MHKLFVFVRRDLPRNVQTVQAIHAATVLVAGLAPGSLTDETPAVVYAVDDDQFADLCLMRLGTFVYVSSIDHWYVFTEPGIGRTAIAYLGEALPGFADLRLL